MAFTLRQGLSYCAVDGRLLFLDICADRYFRLEKNAEAAFRDLADDPAPRADDPVLIRLQGTGLLVEGPVQALAPCDVGLSATDSLLDIDLPSAPVGACLSALMTLFETRRRLRRDGLGFALKSLRAQLSHAQSRRAADPVIHSLVAAFETSARLTRSHDQCLVRSLSLAGALAARGVGTELVIGVRLRPFAAHCWVQHGHILINDRPDPVSSFTPIFRA